MEKKLYKRCFECKFQKVNPKINSKENWCRKFSLPLYEAWECFCTKLKGFEKITKNKLEVMYYIDGKQVSKKEFFRIWDP